MSKNKVKKQRAAQRKRQRRALKTTRRVATPPKSETFHLSQEEWPDHQQDFWLANGVNYLLSDYEAGTWTPLFPDIYQEEPKVPNTETLLRQVLSLVENDEATPRQNSAIAWTMQGRGLVWSFAMKASRAVHEAGDAEGKGLTAPHNPHVWGVFQRLYTHEGMRDA